MSTEAERLEDQLRRALAGEAWHGPAVLEALAGVSAEQAAAHPVEGAHSIWELTLHLTGTYRLVLRRLAGDGTQLAPEDDWPPVPPVDAESWNSTLRVLRELNQDVRRAVAGFPPDRLDRPLVAEVPHTAYTQFVGITQHDLYHAGQISLLKRALAGRGGSQR